MTTNRTESFIQPDGSLVIRLPSDHVSWFSFLQYSRATNSEYGGWDSQSHWKKRGLEILEQPSLDLSAWSNSQKDSLPNPRTKDFMFSRELSAERKKLTLDGISESPSENELNARLFKKGSLRLDGREIKLIGYEIPLTDDSKGQLKVDLIGVSGGGTLEVIELKKGNNKGDSPLIAFVEAFCYGLQINRCWENFCREIQKTANTSLSSEKINLTILAPTAYWEEWINKGKSEVISRSILQKRLKEISKRASLKEHIPMEVFLADLDLADL